MNYKIINSGSDGNATIIEDIVLIDCGVSFKKLQLYYKKLKLVLLTHIHSDHFNKTTIRRLAYERPTLRFGCHDWLVKDLVECGVKKENIDIYEYDYSCYYGAKMIITTYPLMHDVPNCAYLIQLNKSYFYATDTNSLEQVKLPYSCDLYLIEGNYEDEEELQKRKFDHIQKGQFYYEDRVQKTHLSKVKALDWLLNNMNSNSKYVFMHEHKEGVLNETT